MIQIHTNEATTLGHLPYTSAALPYTSEVPLNNGPLRRSIQPVARGVKVNSRNTPRARIQALASLLIRTVRCPERNR